MSYPFKSIWMNGRFVSLDAIITDQEIPITDFEKHTFSFIRDWLAGEEKFTLQTSGSTGEPKTISITRQQMIASAVSTAHALRLEQNHNALICIDTKYIGGKMMVVRAFVTGMRIWAVDPCACPLQKIPVDHCVNFAAFVPYQVQSMLGSKHPHLLDNPDVIIIGGAPLHEELINQLQTLLCRCYATYGMTETISHVALRKLNGPDRSEYFVALPGVELEKDERDCLVLTVPFLTEKIRTNDLADIIDGGKFKWLGRLDNVINSGGVKLVPEKVEQTLHLLLKEAGIHHRFFIHGVEDNKLGHKVALVLEATGHTGPAGETLLNIFEKLPPFERPRLILYTPQFATTETGKINRIQTIATAERSFPLLEK